MPTPLRIEDRSPVELAGVLESLIWANAPSADDLNVEALPVSLDGTLVGYAQALLQGVLAWAWRERMTANEFYEHYQYGTTGGTYSRWFVAEAYAHVLETGRVAGLTERDADDPLLLRPKAGAPFGQVARRLSAYQSPDVRHFAAVCWHIAATTGAQRTHRFFDYRVFGENGDSFTEARSGPWVALDEALVNRWLRFRFPLGPRGDEGAFPARSHSLRGGVRGGTAGLKGLAQLIARIEAAMTQGQRDITQSETTEVVLAAERVVQIVERACVPVTTTAQACAEPPWLVPLTLASIGGRAERLPFLLSFEYLVPNWSDDLATLSADEARRALQALSVHTAFRVWAAENGVALPDFEEEIGVGPVFGLGPTDPTRRQSERRRRGGLTTNTPLPGVGLTTDPGVLQPGGAQQAGGGVLLGLAALGLGIGYLYKEGKL